MSTIEGTTARHVPMTSAEYHRERDHDSNSSVKQFLRSPMFYFGVRIAGTMVDPPTSDAMRKGSVGHILMEDPRTFDDLVTVIPDDVLAKNGAKSGNALKDWAAENAGKLHVKQAELDVLKRQCESIWSNEDASRLLRSATVREHSLFWQTDDGHQVKCRIDAGAELDAEIVDLKFSAHGKGDKFVRHVRDLKWHCQAALYSDGFEAFYGVPPTFTFVVVENSAPYECWAWTLPEEFIEAGRQEYRKALTGIRQCRESGRWYPEGYGQRRELFIPPYFLPAVDDYPEV